MAELLFIKNIFLIITKNNYYEDEDEDEDDDRPLLDESCLLTL